MTGLPWPCPHLTAAAVICPECSRPAPDTSNTWPSDRQVPWPCPTRAALDQALRANPAVAAAARAAAADIDDLLEHLAAVRAAIAVAITRLSTAAADDRTGPDWEAIATAIDQLRAAHQRTADLGGDDAEARR